MGLFVSVMRGPTRFARPSHSGHSSRAYFLASACDDQHARSLLRFIEARDFAAVRAWSTHDFVGCQRTEAVCWEYRGFDGWMQYVTMLRREVDDTMKLMPQEFFDTDPVEIEAFYS